MELHQIHHVVHASAAMIQSKQMILNGHAALARSIKVPSSVLGERIEQTNCVDLLIYENNEPEACTALINLTFGPESSFYELYGYYVNATESWHAPLPTGWVDRLEYMNNTLTNLSPHVLCVSAADIVLARLRHERDTLLAMDLMAGGVFSLEHVLSLIDNWDLKESERFELRTQVLQIAKTLDLTLKDAKPEETYSGQSAQVLPLFGTPSRRRHTYSSSSQ